MDLMEEISSTMSEREQKRWIKKLKAGSEKLIRLMEKFNNGNGEQHVEESGQGNVGSYSADAEESV